MAHREGQARRAICRSCASTRASSTSSAATLADALDKQSAFDKELSRLYVYASMLADQDTRDATHEGMRQEMVQLAATFSADASFIEPEILKTDKATIETFIASEPRLKVYRFYLRRRDSPAPTHTLSDAEEKLLADAGPLAGAPSNVFNILSNADFPYPTRHAERRQDASKLDQAAFADLRALPNRADREKVMSAFFNALGIVQPHVRHDDERRSAEGAVLREGAEVSVGARDACSTARTFPTSVYTRLIDGVNKNLPAFHRYLKLRKRMMGLDQLHYYDLYAPLVASVESRIHAGGSAEARARGGRAARRRTIRRRSSARSTSRWIDLFPNEGKASGAYSNGGAYDVHPYMLINYNGQYADVSTLAHELGHTMQSYFSNKTQPYPLAGYPIFVAEVASTFNESLLIDYMLKHIKDDDTRLSLLGNYLENIKGTVFRQTQFAEFELRMHEMAREGAADHRRRAREAVHGHHEAVLRPRSGRLHRRRLHRARVELHPALLPRLLRLPVRDVVHGLGGARRRR